MNPMDIRVANGTVSRITLGPKTLWNRANIDAVAYFPFNGVLTEHVNGLLPTNIPASNFITVSGRTGLSIASSADVVDLGDVLDTEMQDFTISMWLYPRSVDLGRRWVMSKSEAAARPMRWAVGYSDTKLSAFMQANPSSIPDPDVVLIGTEDLSLNTWNHCVWSFDRSGSITLYLNGIFSGAVDISYWSDVPFDSVYPTLIGAYRQPNDDYMAIPDAVVSDVIMIPSTSTAADCPRLSNLVPNQNIIR